MTSKLLSAGFAATLLFAAPVFADASPDAFGAPIADTELAELAGGDDVLVGVITDQILTATNSGNTVSGQTVSSGAITLNADALSGFDGVGNFVFNTGHNNNLQSSMNITIVMPQ